MVLLIVWNSYKKASMVLEFTAAPLRKREICGKLIYLVPEINNCSVFQQNIGGA
jgi:hypothetical protein